MRRRPLVSLIATGAALAILVMLTAPSKAQGDDPGLLKLTPELGIGTWFGSGTVGGTAILSEEGVEVEMTLDQYGGFFFDVRGPSYGDVEGEWDIIAPSSSRNVFTFEDGAIGIFDATYLGGGPVLGSPKKLNVRAEVEQTGTFTVDETGYSANVTEQLTSPLGVSVTSAFCNEAYGEWTVYWALMFEGLDWSPFFDGNWVAVRQTPEFEEAIEDGRTPQDLVKRLNEALDDWDVVAGDMRTRDWDSSFSEEEWEEIIVVFEQIENWLNQIRNLTPCERLHYGDADLEYFESALTDSLSEIVAVAVASGDLSASDVNDVIDLGLRSGAIRPGSADSSDEALREQANAELESVTKGRTDSDGEEQIGWAGVNNETLEQIVRAGQKMGWDSFDVHGIRVPVAKLAGVFGT